VIGASAAGIDLLWAGQQVDAALIAVAYWGEPVMGYFIYKRLREVSRLWAALFLGSAAAYAYTLPAVLLGLRQVPAAADAAKLAALVYYLGRLR
jgi:ABC-type Co2+ transport system permease subunit